LHLDCYPYTLYVANLILNNLTSSLQSTASSGKIVVALPRLNILSTRYETTATISVLASWSVETFLLSNCSFHKQQFIADKIVQQQPRVFLQSVIERHHNTLIAF